MNIDVLRNIKINFIGKTRCKPDWNWHSKSGHDKDFNLWTVLDGKGLLETPLKTYDLSGGDCFLLRGDEDYFGNMNGSDYMTVIYIHFDFLNMKGEIIKPQKQETPRLYRKIDNETFLYQILEKTVKLHLNGKKFEAAEWLKVALLEIKEQDEYDTYSTNNIVNFMEDICRKIKENPEKRYHLGQIAEKACYCPEHFSRLFKKITGSSFRNYVMESRIEAAKGLLTSTSYSINRIADILGYNDVFLFSKQFRKMVGKTPTEFKG